MYTAPKGLLKVLGFISLLAAAVWFQSAARSPNRSIAQPAALSSTSAVPLELASPQPTSPFAIPQPTAQLINMSEPSLEPSSIVTNFRQSDEVARWRSVDDSVMGGVSQGGIALSDNGTGVFQGLLSLENNGGFSSIRRDASGHDFSDAASIIARVKGDGRRYQLRLNTLDANSVTYRATFDTEADAWQTVAVPLADFEPVFRGSVVDSAPPLRANGIYEVGFLIADKRSGDFRLEIDWIAAE